MVVQCARFFYGVRSDVISARLMSEVTCCRYATRRVAANHRNGQFRSRLLTHCHPVKALAYHALLFMPLFVLIPWYCYIAVYS